MKRLLMIIPIATLAVAGFAPAQAADPPETTPIVASCLATGGYGEDGLWRAGHAALSGQGGTLPLCSTVYEVQGPPTGCDPIPDDPSLWAILEALDCPTERVIPVGYEQTLRLTAEGDFACGSGTLTTDPLFSTTIGEYAGGADNDLTYVTGTGPGGQGWRMEWTATFSDGVGQMTGTAVPTQGNTVTGEARQLSGTMVIEDRAATGVYCENRYPFQYVAVHLVFS